MLQVSCYLSVYFSLRISQHFEPLLSHNVGTLHNRHRVALWHILCAIARRPHRVIFLLFSSIRTSHFTSDAGSISLLFFPVHCKFTAWDGSHELLRFLFLFSRHFVKLVNNTSKTGHWKVSVKELTNFFYVV